MAGEGWPSNAVDGIPTIVHEGRKCTETKSEKSPWWTVDLLKVQVRQAMTIHQHPTDTSLTGYIEYAVSHSDTHCGDVTLSFLMRAEHWRPEYLADLDDISNPVLGCPQSEPSNTTSLGLVYTYSASPN